MTADTPQPVATLRELSTARRLVRTIDGVEVLLLKTSAGVVAFRNACTHLALPLDQGRVFAGQLHCPYHGAAFDLVTGRAMSGPAVSPLQRFAVRVEGDEVFVLRAETPEA